MPLLDENQMIRDTYRVERLLGEGAFAEVYRVMHKYLGRHAMKVFKRPPLSSGELLATLEEALLLSKLGHPNIVRVFEANTFETPRGELGYFTMEYVPGGTLADHLFRSRGFLPVAEAVDIAVQVCRGISVAHRKVPPIIHRDIKPHNLLMGDDGDGTRVIVSDFGLARTVNPYTLMASSRGTMAFKAPETFIDPRADSRAGDVWAIGCVLYLMLTGEMPHPDLIRASPLAGLGYTGRLIAPSELRYAVDPSLDAIVTRALALDPLQRYPTAVQLLADLEAWDPAAEPAQPAEPPATEMAGTPPTGPTAPGGADATGTDSAPTAVTAGDAAAAANQLREEALRLVREGRTDDSARRLTAAYDLVPDARDHDGSQEQLVRRGVVM